MVGQIGQSIDGRIATVTGHSKYINGPAGLAHLHRLRALVDAVLVGIGTAVADDPQLTVRRVAGPSPARIVLDPKGRMPPNAKVLADDGIRRIVITAEGVQPPLPGGRRNRRSAGARAVKSLRRRSSRRWPSAGFSRILIEGGAHTVSRFIAAGCLDRLHVMVAPIMHRRRPGRESPSSRSIAPIRRCSAPMRAHLIGEEVLLRLRSVGSARRHRPGEKVDVTDPHG